MPDARDDDAALLQRSAAGDADAFAQFVARHRAGVHRFTTMLAHDAHDAEEVLQQTFVQAYRHAAGARVDGGARAWLLTIARHALARMRREAHAADTVSLEQLGREAGFADPAATPERVAAAVESRDLLHAALAALAPADREVLVLRELEQLDGDRTAAVLGLSLEAMKSRLHRARLRLLAEVRRRMPAGDEP